MRIAQRNKLLTILQGSNLQQRREEITRGPRGGSAKGGTARSGRSTESRAACVRRDARAQQRMLEVGEKLKSKKDEE